MREAIRPLHVLLVDDDVPDLTLLQDAFESAGPVVLTVCDDARTLLAFLRAPGRVLPDVMVLDLHLSGVSGFELLALLKQDAQLCRLLVVVLSGSDNPADVEQAYRSHASAYLIKSMTLDRLHQQVKTFVDFWNFCLFPL